MKLGMTFAIFLSAALCAHAERPPMHGAHRRGAEMRQQQTKEQAKALLDCARWKCHDCIEDGESCRKCQLYKLLEATTPMDDYGDGMICPYSLAQWGD